MEKMKQHGRNASKKWGFFEFFTDTEKLISSFLPPALLVFMTTLLYSRSLFYPFQFDDIANISKRFGIRFDNPLSRWLGSSRWLGDWLNIINFKIGGFDPFTYRLVNLIIHISTGLCLFYLVRHLCSFFQKEHFLYRYSQYISFSVAALFLLHPVQTQTVSYVIQARMEGLAGLFVVLTILFFIKAVKATRSLEKIAWGFAVGFGSFLACGTKEVVVVLPFLLLLVDWFFVSQQQWALFKKRALIYLLFGVFFLAFLLYKLDVRMVIDTLMFRGVITNNRGNIITDGAFDHITAYTYFISEFRVILHYLFIYVWPFGLSVEYDWKVASGFWTLKVLLPLLVLVPLLLFVFYSAFKKRRPIFTFGLLWFFICVAPRSTVMPSPELVCDYKSYLASIGVIIILGIGLVRATIWITGVIDRLALPSYTKEMYIGALCLLLVPVALISYERNKVWETCVAFWQDNVAKAPGKARVHNNFGVALSESGRVDEAIVSYKKAIELDKFYADPLSNIAVAYSLKGQTDDAIEALRGAIHICPNYPEAYNNLGTLLIQKKQYQEAEEMLNFALQMRPYYGKAFYNKARMYEELGNEDKAYENLKLATKGDLDTPEAFFKLGQLCLKMKKYDEAENEFNKLVALGVDNEQVWFNLANATFMRGNHNKAISIYERLVAKNPLDSRYIYNLAESYFTKNDFARAYDMFRRATTIPQPLGQAFFRAAHCLEKMNNIEGAKAYLKSLEGVNAPAEFKKVLTTELMRLELQSKIKVTPDGKTQIAYKDLRNVMLPHINDKKNEVKKG